MLYNDIVIDGMIKRAAYQAAQETVYMMKRAAATDLDEGFGSLGGGSNLEASGTPKGEILRIIDKIKGAVGDWNDKRKARREKADQENAAWEASTEGLLDSNMNNLKRILADEAIARATREAENSNPALDVITEQNTGSAPISDEATEEQRDKQLPGMPQIINPIDSMTEEEKEALRRDAAFKKIFRHLDNNKFTYGGGVAGAGIGALLGDTPKDRLLYAILGGGGGAGLGALADHYLK